MLINTEDVTTIANGTYWGSTGQSHRTGVNVQQLRNQPSIGKKRKIFFLETKIRHSFSTIVNSIFPNIMQQPTDYNKSMFPAQPVLPLYHL